MSVLGENARRVFENLYSFQNEKIDGTFERVAREFAISDNDYNLAFKLQKENIWRPNTPTYLNAGKENKIFSACYVVPLKDSMNSIYDIADVCRKIFQYGAGVGIPIGNLREREAYIYEGKPDVPPEGKSSGPITFMKLYDAVGETTKSGGRVRRAAIMVDMPVWHPDIMEFISCKEIDGRLANMNISVAITDEFMECLENNTPFTLRSPYDGSSRGTIDPSEVWDKLVEMGWKTADPGVFFIDNMNKFNPLKRKMLVETTNPCGEQPLIPFGCCNLCAINLGKFANKELEDQYDWEGLYRTSYDVMGLMDNVIDVMDFPDKRFKDVALKYRPVGVGIMGLADAMFMLDIKYDSKEGRDFASKIMETVTTACIDKSADLAKEKGKFYDYDVFKEDVERIVSSLITNEDVINKVKENGLRNSQHTTCQPTGTVAISCDASYGIEPCFGLTFEKHLIEGDTMLFTNNIFEDRFKDEEWYNQSLVNKIFSNSGSLKGLHGIPKEVRDVFVVAHDIRTKDRVDMQAALQKHCSTAISSTVNLPSSTGKEEISDLYKYSYKKGLKGITIYRDGCKQNQPVTFNKTEKPLDNFKRPSRLKGEVFTLDTGSGKMYVTVASTAGKPVEIFLQIGKSGQIMNTMTEAIGRIISIALQNGVPLDNLTKTLIDINSDRPVWSRFEENEKKPTQILSIPDGLAKLLNKYYVRDSEEGFEPLGELCTNCGQHAVKNLEGCKTCFNCNFSRCS
jgi:ribonucleoside-diphosphate reductase alpha chain